MLRLGTACRGKKSYPDRALPLWSPVVTCFKSMINLVEAAHGQGPTRLTWYKAGDGLCGHSGRTLGKKDQPQKRCLLSCLTCSVTRALKPPRGTPTGPSPACRQPEKDRRTPSRSFLAYRSFLHEPHTNSLLREVRQSRAQSHGSQHVHRGAAGP